MSGKKVRSKAPLRLGFGGGGTDLSPFCDLYGGVVLNATINKFSYCTIEGNADNFVYMEASDINESRIAYASEILEKSNICMLISGVYAHLLSLDYITYTPLKIYTYSDVPGGSGLGSSSTMVVAILQAFVEYFNLPFGEYDIAEMAYRIERNYLGLKGGKQDQFCAAFGGWNFMEFYKDKTIVNPLRIKQETLNEFSSSLVIAFVGEQRSSGDVIEKQVKEQSKNKEALLSLKDRAIEMKEKIFKGDIFGFGEVLNKSWEDKKKTASIISNEYIDNVYNIAKSSGAYAAKLSGAGSSGFMMFMVEPQNKIKLKKALNEIGILAEDVQFSKEGVVSWEVLN